MFLSFGENVIAGQQDRYDSGDVEAVGLFDPERAALERIIGRR